MTLTPGTGIGNYKVLGLLGAGGMGEVYLAEDTRLGRKVAIKIVSAALAADASSRRRLLREARLAAALSHPHICTVFDVGETEDVTYLAIEYIDGTSLRDLLANGPLPLEAVIRYGRQIADALAHAHEHAVVHRDLKSANIMITRQGDAKVVDFGIARRLPDEMDHDDVTVTATAGDARVVAGTLAYLAPECLRGEQASERTDIWSLGVVLHEAATGTRPFRGGTAFELSSDILTTTLPVLPDRVDDRLAATIRRCLANDPAERYGKAIEVRASLETLQSPVSVSRKTDGTSAEARVGTDVGAPVQALAVLPLANLSGDPAQEYFSDGMTDARITELAKVRALKVISRTSVMRYKDTRQPLSTIARELGVDALVEGSVLRVGAQVRITAQLVHATDTHLWAESYDRDVDNVLSLQKEVARDIVHRIEVALTPTENERLSAGKPVNPAVYEAILKGRFYQYMFSQEGLEKAEFWLRRAIELDPDSAAAHSGLANLFGAIGGWGDVRPLDVWPEAERLARRALELDDTMAESHLVFGALQAFAHRDWDGGERAMRRGLELNLADAYYNYGLLRLGRGHLEEAARLLDRAIELDPLNPGVVADSAFSLLPLGRLDEAETRIRDALELAPTFWRANWLLAPTLELRGEFAEAVRAARLSVEQSGGNVRSVASLVATLVGAGEEDEARQTLKSLLDSATDRYLAPYAIATAYAALHEIDEAFQWLERGYEEHDLFMLFLGVDPRVRAVLGGDARYPALIARLGLS